MNRSKIHSDSTQMMTTNNIIKKNLNRSNLVSVLASHVDRFFDLHRTIKKKNHKIWAIKFWNKKKLILKKYFF